MTQYDILCKDETGFTYWSAHAAPTREQCSEEVAKFILPGHEVVEVFAVEDRDADARPSQFSIWGVR